MILHRYFARRFAWSFLLTLSGFFLLMLLIDIVEQLRRFGGDASLGSLLQLTLLNLPSGLYDVLPLIMVLATIAMFLGCLLYTSPSPRDATLSRMPSSA